MDQLVNQFLATSAKLDMLDFYINDLLGGLIFSLAILMAVRFVIRALAASWFGKRNGSLVSSVAEALATILILLTAYKNPGVVITALAWSATLFRQFIVYFRGG
jgi:small-conductance mechanosensitive channel